MGGGSSPVRPHRGPSRSTALAASSFNSRSCEVTPRPQLLPRFGIEPTERRILGLKSAGHFRAAFEPIATKVIEVDAPGISSPNLTTFPYQRLRCPIYPLDPEATWSPAL